MNKYSFIEILNSEIKSDASTLRFNGIKIPIIQRDYAQGRRKEAAVRNRFLKSIFKALESGADLELDFVYGALKSIDSSLLFVPLDGQQRLTTLFLLNWYIGTRELEGQQLTELRDTLNKFTYATRFSSNIFCEKLCREAISFEMHPSLEIMDSSWFFDSFILDPTIQSMLVMLDAIHDNYNKLGLKLFSGLDKIKFYFLSLDGFDLTDELYIKMNARGKQLSNFENFKADLIKWIQNEKKSLKDQILYKGVPLDYHLYFELKLDNEWTGLFWNHSKTHTSEKDKLVDPYMMNFFNRYFLNSYIAFSSLNQSEIENDSRFKLIYGIQGDDSKILYNNFDSYAQIAKVSSVSQNRIYLLEKVLNALSIHGPVINEMLAPGWNKNENWNLFSKTINQRQRIILFAVTVYLEKFEFNKEKFCDWIRFVWNIIIDPNLRSISAMVSALRFINEFSENSDDILNYLINTDLISAYSSSAYYAQLLEEQRKAVLIQKSAEWKCEIIEAESHKLFQGNIHFLLADKAVNDVQYFKRFKDAAFSVFADNDLTDKKPDNYLWVRALLAKSKGIKLPVSFTNGNFNHWRFLINSSFTNAMRLLLDELAESNLGAEDCMAAICNNYTADPTQEWVFPLVHWTGKNGETLLGNYSETRKIQSYNYYGASPDHIYLYNKTVWTEGNIILSGNRNKTINALLKKTEAKIDNQWLNISKTFFRGWNIRFERKIADLPFVYIFDHSYLTIGIKLSEEISNKFPDYIISDANKENNWFFRKRYKFSDQKDNTIDSFLDAIENEIFDIENTESFVNKITAAKKQTKIN